MDWCDMPEHILEKIFLLVKDGSEIHEYKDLVQISSVCQSWRHVAKQLLFSSPWSQGPNIFHMSQLFTLCPKPVQSGLVRCYVKREAITRTVLLPSRSYTLYQNQEWGQMQTTKFLLSAVQQGRCNYNISIKKDKPSPSDCFAKVRNSVPRAHFHLHVSKHAQWAHRQLLSSGYLSLPSSDCKEDRQKSGSLMRVTYLLRMRGMVLPRRMKVELPTPVVTSHCNPLYAHALPSPCRAENDVPLPQVLADQTAVDDLEEEEGSRTPPWLVDVNQGPSSSSSSQEDIDLTTMLVPTWKPEGRLAFARRISGDGELCGDKMLSLKNKPPHWNESLKCWCLNFKGRVKLASVKNFQLVCSKDDVARIVMQFGKVDSDTFVLDYNPCVMSALQAFSIALTSYGTKYLI